MKVWVSVHGRFHAFELASELARRQALAGVATTYPRALARRHLPPGSVLKTAPWLEAYRRLYQALPLGPRPDVPIACAFGRFAAAALPDRADILVGWSGATLEAISPAQRRGMRVVIERGSTHIGHQAEVLGAEYQRLGISGAAVDPVLIERESEEYQAADAIAVPSHFAADTFISRGIDPKKLIVNPYGADLTRYAERRSGSNASIIRVLLVGQVGARKGVPWLLKAFRHLGPQFRLQLVGPVEHYMHPFLRAEDPDRIQVSGPPVSYTHLTLPTKA